MEFHKINAYLSKPRPRLKKADWPITATTYSTYPYLGQVSTLKLTFKAEGMIYELFLSNEEMMALKGQIDSQIRKAQEERKYDPCMQAY